jgi:methylmalonyl-CoA mutase N-terminal domain/subunit
VQRQRLSGAASHFRPPPRPGTQQVIAHESGVVNTVDPLGGSYFVEKLTDEMERAAYEYFARIDELGGMVEAIRQNFPQREIAEASFRYQTELGERRRIVVGVNDFIDEDEEQIPILRIDPGLERKQTERLAATRGRRDAAEVERKLGELRHAAATDENLMPHIIEAARARATVGEMVAALQEVFGTYRELPVF